MMQNQVCPKCGSAGMVRTFGRWVCKNCFSYATYWQQSIIETQKEQITKYEELLSHWHGYAWKDDLYIDNIQEYFDAEVLKIKEELTKKSKEE